MKYFLNIFIVITFSVSLLYAQDCKSIVNIEAGEVNNLIYVDNEYLGNGKVEIELLKGSHVIKIKEPGFRWDARTLSKNIEIINCNDSYSFNLKLDKEYLIDTLPSDAYVFNTDTLLGKTPLFISSEINSILIRKNDYQAKKIDISSLSPLKPISLDFTGEIKTKSFTDTPFFELLIGTAVGFGAVAAYYKIQADQSFNKYESTKEQKYLDETNRFDNYSGIALGVLQLNFGALIYLLLSD